VWLVSSFTTHVLCGLYSIIVVVIGLVLSLATAFTHELGQESYYLEVCVRRRYVIVGVVSWYRCITPAGGISLRTLFAIGRVVGV